MSNKKKSEEDWEIEELARILSGNFEEEDFDHWFIDNTWEYPDSDLNLDTEKDTPPPTPKEPECKHEETEKKQLIFTEYLVCKKCKKDLGDA